MRGKWIGGAVATIASALLVLAAPAAAWTLEWEPVGATAAGGSTQAEIAAIAGVPYATWVDSGHVRVSALATDGSWRTVGGVVNRDPSEAAANPHLADINGTPWITWAEQDALGTAQLRVAKLVNGAWQEVVGGDRPINRSPDDPNGPGLYSAYEGRLAAFGGHVYVAFRESNPSDIDAFVSRLSDDGSAWQPVGSLPNGKSASGTIDILVSNGQLHVGYDSRVGGVWVSRLNGSQTDWTLVGTSVTGALPDGIFSALTDAAGTLEVLWTKGDGPSAQLSKLGSGDQWIALTTDSDIPGFAADVTQAGGRPYVASIGNDAIAHVAFLTGTGWEQAPDPSNEVAPPTLPSLATIGDEPYVGYDRMGDECVARLDGGVDSIPDDDSCGPAFGTTATSQSQAVPPPETPAGPAGPGDAVAPQAPACHVPRLKGKTLRAARRLLAKAHCGLGFVRHHPSRKFRRGRVMRSTPGAGARLGNHAVVNLVLAR